MIDPAALERLRQKVLAYDRHQAMSAHFGSAEERDAWNAELERLLWTVLGSAQEVFGGRAALQPPQSPPRIEVFTDAEEPVVFGSQADAAGAFEEYAYALWLREFRGPGVTDEIRWNFWIESREAFIADLKARKEQQP